MLKENINEIKEVNLQEIENKLNLKLENTRKQLLKLTITGDCIVGELSSILQLYYGLKSDLRSLLSYKFDVKFSLFSSSIENNDELEDLRLSIYKELDNELLILDIKFENFENLSSDIQANKIQDLYLWKETTITLIISTLLKQSVGEIDISKINIITTEYDEYKSQTVYELLKIFEYVKEYSKKLQIFEQDIDLVNLLNEKDKELKITIDKLEVITLDFKKITKKYRDSLTDGANSNRGLIQIEQLDTIRRQNEKIKLIENINIQVEYEKIKLSQSLNSANDCIQGLRTKLEHARNLYHRDLGKFQPSLINNLHDQLDSQNYIKSIKSESNMLLAKIKANDKLIYELEERNISLEDKINNLKIEKENDDNLIKNLLNNLSEKDNHLKKLNEEKIKAELISNQALIDINNAKEKKAEAESIVIEYQIEVSEMEKYIIQLQNLVETTEHELKLQKDELLKNKAELLSNKLYMTKIEDDLMSLSSKGMTYEKQLEWDELELRLSKTRDLLSQVRRQLSISNNKNKEIIEM